ncbi:TPA: glycosyltransferase family 4 protein [Vibrio parahaemolyticus]|nr:glycosyltransferase family 4 protein [Vibrio parahaemolyticus]HCG7350106.1 glycosyltransferase family 4 protein [Vibrio parahaemolyticus]
MYIIKDALFRVYNYSHVIGGQEVYLKRILTSISKKGGEVDFVGKPKLGNYCFNSGTRERLVVLLNGNAALYKFLFKRIPGDISVYVQHSSISDNQAPKWKRFVRKLIFRVALSRFDLVVRVCDFALPSDYAPKKTVTIYNGVPVSDARKNNKKFSYRLLMVGALNENKNQIMAIKALKLLPDASLTIVGEGAERKSLELAAKNYGVSSRVKFVGFLDNPNDYYNSHDLLLMLSYNEAFPNVVLEAMAAYCPVVSVKVGGVPEVIDSGSNGWLLDSYSYKELANKINVIGQDLPAYERIAKRARLTIEERFTEEHMVDQLLDEIEKRYKKL